MSDPVHHLLTRDAARVSGPDAAAYLQGQLSQDVASLDAGGSVWSWLLAPAGKVDALVRVTRLDPDTLLVDTDRGWGEAVVARLNRFKLRSKLDIVPAGLDVLAVRGDGAAATTGTPLAPLWRGAEAADRIADLPGADHPAPDAAGPLLDAAGWEAARILAGVPAMGAELTERTIPAETGLIPVTVSFTKGCYTGQELVARIDSRGGNVARHLRLLRSDAPLPPGTELRAGGKVVGAVTSAAGHAGRGVALAYVGRAVEPGATVDAGGAAATVEALAPAGT